MSELNRREAIGAMAATAVTAGINSAAHPAERRPDLIRGENDREGTADWQITYAKFDAKAKFRQSLIEGYCTRMSARAGDTIGFCVSTDPPSPFTIDVYRLGYYAGSGGRHVTRLGPFEGKAQPVPPVGEKRLRECKWEPCTTLTIPKEWPSGVYLGKLFASRHRYQSSVVFVVTDDRPADVLFQCSTNTWQAYNKWPDMHCPI
jgi:hypothetical protein